MGWTGTVLAVLVAVVCSGQDADTIVLKSDRRSFALLSQIEDQQEAKAFSTLLQTKGSVERYRLAKQFETTYPKSWLLTQAYEISARSAIDLAEFDEAIADGRFSLRLLPENPGLLVVLANLEAQRGVDSAALQDAADALEYLDLIERPANVTEKEWNGMKPQLRAAAYFARGRVLAAQGLRDSPHDMEKLSLAFENLNSSLAWNAQDAETLYLRAIVELQLGRQQEAVSDLSFVRERENPLKGKAEEILQLLAKGKSLDKLTRDAPAPRIDIGLRAEPSRRDDSKAIAAGYAGPEACRSCHASEYETWRKTGMANMLRPYSAGNVIGDFTAGTEFKEGETDQIRMGTHGRPFFEVSGTSGWERFYVDYTIGSKWQQGYATKLPDGRLQVVPIESNRLQGRWVNYWRIIDPPGSPRSVIHDFPKMTAATNYQQNCAICHTSQLRSNADSAADPMQHATFLQPGIDCEMCHGPSAGHVRRAEKGDLAALPFDFRKVGNREGVRVCAQCHRQSAVREVGQGGEMNYSTQRDFIPTTWLRSYDAFSRKAFYKDGRFRETTFIAEAFTRSACYRKGAAQCATCHSPHQPDFGHNLTSLKSAHDPNELCLSCHPQFRSRNTEHTRHAAGSEASQCVTCHMPRIMNAVLFQARSHQIEIPTADMTERFGQADSPNVCMSCHAEKTTAWAKEQLAAWRN